MVSYTVTISIDKDIHDNWLQWMKDKHIPDVLKTGMFEGHEITKESMDLSDGKVAYAIRYFCKDMSHYERYQVEYAPRLQAEHEEMFRDKFSATRTVEEIQV